MLKKHLITDHKISGTGTFDDFYLIGTGYNVDIWFVEQYLSFQSTYLGGLLSTGIEVLGPDGKDASFDAFSDAGVMGGWSPFVSLTTSYADSKSYIVGDTAIGIQPNYDFDDYIQFQTISHIPEITTVGDCDLKLSASSGRIGMGLTPTANMAGLSIEAGVLTLKETTTPTADTNYGKIYPKNNNKLYFQDGAGVEHEIQYA